MRQIDEFRPSKTLPPDPPAYRPEEPDAEELAMMRTSIEARNIDPQTLDMNLNPPENP